MKGKIKFSIVLLLVLSLWSVLSIISPTVLADPTITEYSIPSTIADDRPQYITKGPDGALWFTLVGIGTDGTSSIGRVTTSGSFTNFPLDNNPAPSTITSGSDGALWFTETVGRKIIRMDTSGSITNQYSLPDPISGSYPYGITSGSDGALWFTVPNANDIGRLTTDGVFTLYAIPTRSSTPYQITSGPDGALWFVELDGNKIGRITTSGQITEYPLPTQNSEPISITSGPDGAIWFGELGTNQIGRITTSGNITEYPIPTSGSFPGVITTGPNNTLWFTEANTSKIGEITTSGDITEYPTPTEGSGALGIVNGPDNKLWFAENGINQLGTIIINSNQPTTAINAGGDTEGNYTADTDYNGGSTYTTNASIDTSGVTNPAPTAVYQSVRYGNFSYTIPNLTANETYTLQLQFSEPYWGTSQAGGGGVGSRIFNVSVNGTQELSNFDVYQAASGANKAVMEQIPATADSNGDITVTFSNVVDNAMVSGIAVYSGTLPSPTPTPTPTPVSSLAISTGGQGAGSYVADTDYTGGTTYNTNANIDTSGVTNPAPQAVYQNVRYGNNFSYAIPTDNPNSNYTVRLDFAEPYWNAAGSREFNVSINGTQVLNNFDVYQTAGAQNKAVNETFTTTTDSNGLIHIQFTSVTDNAMVSGIQISQQ